MEGLRVKGDYARVEEWRVSEERLVIPLRKKNKAMSKRGTGSRMQSCKFREKKNE